MDDNALKQINQARMQRLPLDVQLSLRQHSAADVAQMLDLLHAEFPDDVPAGPDVPDAGQIAPPVPAQWQVMGQRLRLTDDEIRQRWQERDPAGYQRAQQQAAQQQAPGAVYDWLNRDAAQQQDSSQPVAQGQQGGVTVTDQDRAAAELLRARGREVTPEQIAERRIQGEK